MSGYPMQRAPRCGARTRSGNTCQAPAVRGKRRCRMHGGKSTGRPPIHGRYTQAAIAQKRRWRRLLRELNDLMSKWEGNL